jgi:hypothetical protein
VICPREQEAIDAAAGRENRVAAAHGKEGAGAGPGASRPSSNANCTSGIRGISCA